MQANRKAQKGTMMLNYYDKVSQVFWVSDKYLFHACAMQRIYNLTERQLLRQVAKNEITRQEANKSLETLASKVPPQPATRHPPPFIPHHSTPRPSLLIPPRPICKLQG